MATGSKELGILGEVRREPTGCGGQGRALLTSSLESLGIRGAEEAEEAVEQENGCCSWY